AHPISRPAMAPLTPARATAAKPAAPVAVAPARPVAAAARPAPVRRPDLLVEEEATSVLAGPRPGDPDATVFIGNLGALRRAAEKLQAERDAHVAAEHTTVLPQRPSPRPPR
ncbi:hypothetical protein, partial [Pseudonocardia sp.]|uniref:hypothetical protein n=1 Tax=Pseudonocardia sp. TaxID=60912 RepID=UPI00261412D6